MRQTKMYLAISLLGLSSCLDKSTGGGSDSSSVGSPTVYTSALNAKSQSANATSYRLVRLDGVTPIDGTENDILICTPNMEICSQTCISIYKPELARWSVFRTDYLPGGSCVAFALAYPNGLIIPQMKYWRGAFHFTSGVLGYCSIDVSHPNLDGRGYFDLIKVPSGQASPSPDGARSYYLHSWYDSNNNPLGSFMPRTFTPPANWAYSDNTVTVGEITPQLVSGFSCVKQSEISNAFQ